MAILVTGNTFSSGDQVLAASLNSAVNSSTFASGSVDGSTTELSSGAIIVKDGGITPAKLSTGGPSWVSSGLASLGDLSLTNANPEILGGDADGVMYIAPSTTKDLGGNILLYGNTHASKAEDIEIRGGTGVEAHYDDSASKWDFQANAISTTGVLTAVGTSLTGTAAGLTSGNVTTNANLTGHVTSVGNAAVLGSFTSLQLKNALSNETGSGAAVFATSPTLVTPALGTPASGVMTNATGTAASLTSGNVTTNANLTGHVTSVGNAAVLGSFTSAQLKTALTNETGSGAAVFGTSPTLVTPALGTPASGVMTNATGTAANLTVGATTGVEAGADVTDATNVTAAGALMDSEVTNLAQVKAFDASDYATSSQGTLAAAALPKTGGAMTGAITTNSTFDGVDIATRDGVLTSTTATAAAALPKAGGAMTGAITTNSTFDGRDVATDGTKLDGVEASADVTDATNVTAAGALMDSELTSIANVKALNQSVVSGAAPTFAGTNVTGTASLNINGTVGASSTTTAKVTTLTASTGVLFGSDTAAANTLDDYEEGTWTPVIRGSSTPGTYEISQHYSSYTKVGRLVTLSCKITLAASITAGGSGYTKLTGAPFPKVANTAPNAICATKGVDYAGSFITVEFDSPNATSNLYLTETLDNGGGVDLPIANLAAYDVFVFTISYEV